MSSEYQPHASIPFLESTFENRPIIARWGPSVLHIGPDTQCVSWAMLVAKGYMPAKTFVWSHGRDGAYQKEIASVQTNRDGVFVGRHPFGVPFVLIEDWTYVGDASDATWG